MTEKKIIAFATSDIHLSHKAPIARHEEPCWFLAMARHLRTLNQLSLQHKALILCAGDVFDKWNSPPELINFALRELPPMVAIPGNHDTPLHNVDLLHKSAYWTLVEAEKIEHLAGVQEFKSFVIQGFPFGSELKCNIPESIKKLKIALVHQYVWIQGKGYFGAPEDQKLEGLAGKLEGFDVVVVGDNHNHFQAELGSTKFLNCGSLFRRKKDEANYIPSLGVIYSDGSVESWSLDTSRDHFNGSSDSQDFETVEKFERFLEDEDEGLQTDFKSQLLRNCQHDSQLLSWVERILDGLNNQTL